MEPSPHIPAAPLDLVVHAWQATQAGELIAEVELDFDRRLDETLLATATELLLEAEPILGCELVVDTEEPYWRPQPRGGNRLVVTTDAETYAAFRHSGLDPTQGRQIACCLLRRPSGDQLLIKMSHQVADGGGLQIAVARLSSLYAELHANPGFRPEPRWDTNRDVMTLLPSVPWRAIVWDFVRFMVPRWFPRTSCMLPLPHQSSGPWCFVERHLPAGHVSFLLAYGRQRGATLNDVFLAAAYRALAAQGNWDGSSALRILMTVDLRRYLPADRAGGICNLSTMDCPWLGRELGERFDDTLAAVRSVTQRRKENWPGLAVVWLTYLGLRLEGYHRRANRAGGQAKTRGFPKITLTNTGPIDKARVAFAGTPPVSARVFPSFRKLPGLLVLLSGYDGTLTLSAGTSQNAQSMVASYFDTLIGELPLRESSDLLQPETSAHAK